MSRRGFWILGKREESCGKEGRRVKVDMRKGGAEVGNLGEGKGGDTEID